MSYEFRFYMYLTGFSKQKQILFQKMKFILINKISRIKRSFLVYKRKVDMKKLNLSTIKVMLHRTIFNAKSPILHVTCQLIHCNNVVGCLLKLCNTLWEYVALKIVCIRRHVTCIDCLCNNIALKIVALQWISPEPLYTLYN